MFKSVVVYKIAPGWKPSLEVAEEALKPARFIPCGATQEKAVGWVEPRGEEHGPLIESVGGQWILKLRIQTKAVPGSAVNAKADEEAAHIEATTGRKPGKKEKKALKEDALLALLPQAFARDSAANVWIDFENHWLVTDASSQGKLDELITALVRAFDGLALSLLQTQVTPVTAMTQWLLAVKAEDIPGGFDLGRSVELKSGDEEKSSVKFNRHNISNDEVKKHITEGKLPVKLAMTWEGRISFVMTESMHIKKIDFLEGVFDGRPDEGENGFDADVVLSTGELKKLIPELIEALGGEMEFGKQPGEAVEARESDLVTA
jgi:recombination associated protein RdgC